MKPDILGYTLEECCDLAVKLGDKKFRGQQLFGWMQKGAPLSEMKNLPAAFRERIAEECDYRLPEIAKKQVSQKDGTVKYLMRMTDGECVESVFMRYEHGNTVCVSCQAGCRMGCKFCASSDIPFSRSLTSGEILGQIIAINRHENIRIGHVVIMGIGEPLDNYDNIVKFLKTVISEESLGIGARKISLSTCGLVPGMLKLAEEDLAITLSVSLHNPFDEERSEIMPVNRKYSLDNLFEACKIYIEKTGRRITFEYAMIVGVSDTEKHALELCRRLKGLLCHVNLIPVNAVEGKSYSRSSKKSIENFSAILEKKGISVTVRRELGRDINAACGQLRKQLIEEGNS